MKNSMKPSSITQPVCCGLSDHFALVTENWYFAVPDFLLLSYGGRYMGDKVTVDVGFVNNGDLVKILPIGIPLLGVVIYLWRLICHKYIHLSSPAR